MKRVITLAIVIGLALVSGAVLWRYAPVGHAQQAQVNRTRQVDKELFTGSRARTALAELAREDPALTKALDDSRQYFTSRGFKPADVVVVFRASTAIQIASTNPVDRFLQRIVPSLQASQRFNQQDGYMIASAWDDGNQNTWEGNLYWHHYRSGASEAINIQFNLAAGENSSDPIISAAPGSTTGAVANNWWQGVACLSQDVPVRINRNTWMESWQRIKYAATPCMFSNFGWFNCMAISSVGILVVSGLDQLADYAWTCRCTLSGGQLCS